MKRTKILFALLFSTLVIFIMTSCGHFKDTIKADGTIEKGAWLYSDGVWILFIFAAALVAGGIRVFYISSRGGSEYPATTYRPPIVAPSLPWYKSKWGWALTLVGIGLFFAVIFVQNYNK